MAERVQAVSPLVEPAGDARDLAPFEPLQPAPAAPSQVTAVRQALADAQTGPQLDQLEAAATLNALFAELAPTEANGRLLLELLESDALTGLADRAGLRCRQVAVHALLRLGFPWALEINPDTLAWFRSLESPGGGRGRLALLAVAVLAALGGGAYFMFAPRFDDPPAPPPIVRPVPPVPAVPVAPVDPNSLQSLPPPRVGDCVNGYIIEAPPAPGDHGLVRARRCTFPVDAHP